MLGRVTCGTFEEISGIFLKNISWFSKSFEKNTANIIRRFCEKLEEVWKRTCGKFWENILNILKISSKKYVKIQKRIW